MVPTAVAAIVQLCNYVTPTNGLTILYFFPPPTMNFFVAMGGVGD